MSELILFHHAQGLTPGILAFADELRAGGHTVHTPDLYQGRTFATLEGGIAHAKHLGFGQIEDSGVQAAQGLPERLVYAGFSLGVPAAQRLAQTRRGAAGALFFHGCLPAAEYGSWPQGVPVQIHAMANDSWFEEDLPAARELVDTAQGELFLYPGTAHLFTDRSLSDYDAAATALLKERVLKFLAKTAE